MNFEKIFTGEILFSQKVKVGDSQLVKIQGKIDGLGLFEQYVKEELVPDSIEGKRVELTFVIGLFKFKPSLKLQSIKVMEESASVPF